MPAPSPACGKFCGMVLALLCGPAGLNSDVGSLAHDEKASAVAAAAMSEKKVFFIG